MLVTNSGIPFMKGNVHALIQKKKKSPCSSNCRCQIIYRNYIGLWFPKHLTCFFSHVPILFVGYVCIVSGLASLVCFFCFYFILWLLFWSYVFVVEGMCRIPWMWWVATGPRDHLVAVKAWHIMRRCDHRLCSNLRLGLHGSQFHLLPFQSPAMYPRPAVPHAVDSWTLCSFISSVISCEYNSAK